MRGEGVNLLLGRSARPTPDVAEPRAERVYLMVTSSGSRRGVASELIANTLNESAAYWRQKLAASPCMIDTPLASGRAYRLLQKLLKEGVSCEVLDFQEGSRKLERVRVRLDLVESNKRIQTIKEVRSFFQLGLKEAKTATDHPPHTKSKPQGLPADQPYVIGELPRVEAEGFIKALDNLGSQAVILEKE